MRVVFFGSPEFALPALRRLIESEHEVVGVVTQPDRPTGRGRRPSPSPVKKMAMEHRLRVLQPDSVSSEESVAVLRELAPDVGVLAAYGQILKQRVLDVPPLGILNVHASLLPRWRGAAPVAAAILAGDAQTGATIMRIVRKLDAGPVLDAVALPIAPDATTGTLTAKIAEAGAGLLVGVLPRYASGDLQPAPQDEALVTYAPPIRKGDAIIDWQHDPVEVIARKVRAYNPWPVAYTYLDGEPLRILEATPAGPRPGISPGTMLALDSGGSGFGVGASDGILVVTRVQAPGRRPMLAAEFARGRRDIFGKRLTTGPGAPDQGA